MKRTTGIILIAFTMLFGLMSCVTTGALTPLPKTLNIVSPNPSIGEIAKCSGAWEGRWNNAYSQAVIVVLEEIDYKGVQAIYAYESYQGTPGGWLKVSGKIVSNSVIVLEWGEKGQRRTVTLTLEGDKIKAEYRRANGYSNYATLTKVPIK
jgi:hypothetical protein